MYQKYYLNNVGSQCYLIIWMAITGNFANAWIFIRSQSVLICEMIKVYLKSKIPRREWFSMGMKGENVHHGGWKIISLKRKEKLNFPDAFMMHSWWYASCIKIHQLTLINWQDFCSKFKICDYHDGVCLKYQKLNYPLWAWKCLSKETISYPFPMR